MNLTLTGCSAAGWNSRYNLPRQSSLPAPRLAFEDDSAAQQSPVIARVELNVRWNQHIPEFSRSPQVRRLQTINHGPRRMATWFKSFSTSGLASINRTASAESKSTKSPCDQMRLISK